MLVSNRIIVIDDNRDDLKAICDIFHDNGIGCRGFVYDPFDLPDEPLTGIRFLFIDMNLNPAAGGDIKSSLKDAIKHFISVDNGPYILIFWTNRVEEIESFINFINRDDDDVKLKLKPLHITHIDKNEFVASKDGLIDKIESILSSDIVKCIIKFDESVLEAATKTLNAVLSTINVSDMWGEQSKFDQACRLVFSKIAENVYGLTHAKTCPDMAIKEAIVPIFKHILLHNDDAYWNDYLTPLQNVRKGSELKFPDTFSIEKLNSILHIDTNNLDKKTICNRGAVCTFVEDNLEDNFKNTFGISYQDWFAITFPGVDKATRKKTQLIAVEFSAACDFSQNKKRTNKYILGVLYPQGLKDQIRKDQIGEYTYLFSFNFEIESKICSIGLNLNYTFTLTKGYKLLQDRPLFVLTKEIMDTIGHKYATHVSRIGFSSFG